MSDYKILAVDEAENVMGDYPGEMCFMGRPLGSEYEAARPCQPSSIFT